MGVARNQQVGQPLNSSEAIDHLLERIAGMLVNEPQHVVVGKLEGPEGTLFHLRVGPSDVGRVLGKKGATVKAIRTILGAAGQKLGRRFTLDVLD